MQDNSTHARPEVDRSVALIEVLHDFFDTLDPDDYYMLPTSLQTLLGWTNRVADEIESNPKRPDLHAAGVDWLANRIADLASENRRKADLNGLERDSLFGDIGLSLVPGGRY